MENNAKSNRLEYYSQWGSLACNDPLILRGEDPALLHDWRSDGYPDVESYRLWSANTCGIACLQSILSDQMPTVPSKYSLIQKSLEYQVFKHGLGNEIMGLFYVPFAEMVRKEFGLNARSYGELTLDDLIDLVKDPGTLVMASVSKEIRNPNAHPARRGGHLVLVQHFENDLLYFHNPSGFSNTADYTNCTVEEFAKFFAERGIVVRKKK